MRCSNLKFYFKVVKYQISWVTYVYELTKLHDLSCVMGMTRKGEGEQCKSGIHVHKLLKITGRVCASFETHRPCSAKLAV